MLGVIESLSSDLAHSKVRVNGNCVHYGISVSEAEQQVAESSLKSEMTGKDFGKTFLKIIQHPEFRGQVICHESREDTERFLQA
jgi:hypothetical protein